MNRMTGALLLTLLLSGVGHVFAGDVVPRRVVLVTSDDSVVKPLTLTEIRRLFLGMPVYQDDRRLVPVLKTDDRLLYEVFLQKAMYLSAANYETQLVRRVFQYGGTRPITTDEERQFREILLAEEQHVGFMWESDARRHPEIQIVQTLWQGEST